MSEEMEEILELEFSYRMLIEELKQRGCLSQDFNFPTKAERKDMLEAAIKDFIESFQ